MKNIIIKSISVVIAVFAVIVFNTAFSSCKPDDSVEPVDPASTVTVNYTPEALACLGQATPEEMKIQILGGDILNDPEYIDSQTFPGSQVQNGGSYEMAIPEGAHGIVVKVTFPDGSCLECCADMCEVEEGGKPLLRNTQVFENGSMNETITVGIQRCRDCCG